MIEAVQLWDEPNNRSHWNAELDPDFTRFAELIRSGANALRETAPHVLPILGGVSPIDGTFLRRMGDLGVLDLVHAVAVHGYPLDWNLWKLDEWPAKIAEAQTATGKPVWVTGCGASSFGAEQTQAIALQRTVELLTGRAERIYWNSLLDVPPSWPADTDRKESEGSAYYRHFYLGAIRPDNAPKPAAKMLELYTPSVGIAQWFRVYDPRLGCAASWLQQLGVTRVRTGIRWPDWEAHGPAWFDRLFAALAPFDVTLTLCFTPPGKGVDESEASPVQNPQDFARFVSEIARRYAAPTG